MIKVLNKKVNCIPEHIVSYLVDFIVLDVPDLISEIPMFLIEYNKDESTRNFIFIRSIDFLIKKCYSMR